LFLKSSGSSPSSRSPLQGAGDLFVDFLFIFYNFFKIYSLIFFQNYINAAISNAGSIATAVSAVDPYRHLKQR
jgi:hypothetical protein